MRRLGRVGRLALVALAAAFWFVAYVYLTLPDVRPLATAKPTSTAFMERRAHEAEREGRRFVKQQRWVPYSRISPHLKRAVLVAEDSAFWQHEGIDFEQIRESLEVNVERMAFARGASTITQQLAKNLYLSPSKNPVRKLREFMIARRLEAQLGKQRILELYLNVIEWGDGIFGAEAAARAHFGKAASALGPEEAALLAGAIINPRVLDPGHPSGRLLRRQRMILRRMGHVTPPPDPAGPASDAPGVTPPDQSPPVPAPDTRPNSGASDPPGWAQPHAVRADWLGRGQAAPKIRSGSA
jgi:monofunctional biosynthetic peptidoglycan transglycosylase